MSKQPVEVIVGVNTRIRTVGRWNAASVSADNRPVLDVVHGVVRLRSRDSDAGAWHYLRTGPSTCRFRGERIYSNWDAFKREANHLVADGEVQCVFSDSTIAVTRGKSLWIIKGEPQPVRPTVPLLLRSFSRATDFD